MYLASFTARDIKCFEEVTFTFPEAEPDNYAGWHVILGANATGKTTLLQAIAAALIGPSPAMRLASPAQWVRRGAQRGRISVEFYKGKRDIAEGAPKSGPYRAEFAAIGAEPLEIDGIPYTSPTFALVGKQDKSYRGLLKGPYAANKAGWLVCGYGAFRRLTGGAENDLTYEPGRVGRVASLFHESVALKRDLDWLPRLYARSLDHHAADAGLALSEYQTVRSLLDQLLPPTVQIADVDTQRVYFSAPGAPRVDLLELSDGYRSFLALVMDLLRQIADVFGSVVSQVHQGDGGVLSVPVDGVVLIDEVDLHLHPTWQREIGPRLRQVFPQLQFIVSSHSPFIAQAASRNGLFVVRSPSLHAPVRIVQPAPSVSGWTAEQILLSPLFGLTDTRDPETEALLTEHASLRGKDKFDRLTEDERRRLIQIESALADRLTAPGELQARELAAAERFAADKVRRILDAQARASTAR